VAEAAVSAPLLAAERLHLRHAQAEREAVRDITLTVAAGEIVALVGPNGSGKSTLLAGLARELTPRSGCVRFAGTPLAQLPRRQLARRVARLPQDPAVPEGMTVDALVANGRHPHLSLATWASGAKGRCSSPGSTSCTSSSRSRWT
jgi:iron complex transport system ATP-binding protein